MSEQNKETNWYARRGDRVIGPVTFSKLQELVSTGKLRPEDQVRQSSDDAWNAASEVITFADRASSPTVEPPPIPSAKPQPVSIKKQAEPFLGWYKSHWMTNLRWFYQMPMWIAFGFVWIPIWYILSATPSGGIRTRWESLSLSGKLVACLPLLIFPVLLNGSSRSRNGENLIEAEVVSEKDFKDVDYSFEFDESEYEKIPSGATQLVEKEMFEASQSDGTYLRGTWVETSSYRTSDGQIVPHGVQRFWDNEQKRQLLVERQFSNGSLHGKTTQWNSEGECIGNKLYVNGEFHGRQWRKSDDGTEVESFWLHGKRHGTTKETWPNGRIFSEKWFVNGVQRSPYKEFFSSGKPAEHSTFDEDGKVHGPALRWGSEAHPEPHNLSFKHGLKHGEQIYRGRDGKISLRAIYEDGEVKTPMHPAGQSVGSEMLWDFLYYAGTTGWLKQPKLAKKPSGSIDQESLEELFGRPSQTEDIGIAGISVRSYRCSDGILYFQVRPASQTLALDLLTSDAIALFLTQPWGDELSRTQLFRSALSSVLMSDRYAAEVTQRARNE